MVEGQMPQARRFLVKMRRPSGAASFAVSGATAAFTATPLFSSIQPPPALGVAAPATWHILQPAIALDAGNPWDVCHTLVTQSFGIGGGQAIEFAEPDFEQEWTSGTVAEQARAMTASCEAEPQETGPDGFPGSPDPWWYQDDAHGQFGRALAALGKLDGQRRVRVAHLDTGYDPGHHSLPSGLELALQRNFVDADRPNDAADRSGGLFNNLGHGTGTLSILAGAAPEAGARPGAAPFVNVIPLRVADRVALFYNSSIAQALDYVHKLCATPETEVQVISMSLGGLASQAWAEAVNALYDAGVVLVTAAGNNRDHFPTHNIVYPARFRRVIAACGVMANQAPYADLPGLQMEGNYGPASKMGTALAGYTPNVPWAKFGCPGVLRFNGKGTSSATPQVAAAVAIWLQAHLAQCAALPEKWMRVEAVRRALFGTANPGQGGARPDQKLGMGALRAFDALQIWPDQALLVKEEADVATFGFFRVVTGLGIEPLALPQQRMLELEALQLSQSKAIEELLPDPSRDPLSMTMAERMRLAAALAAHPRASQALRQALQAGPAPTAGPRPLASAVLQQHLAHAVAPQPPSPIERQLRVYAYDPSLGQALATVGINQATITVPWEAGLAPGPVGEYVEVVDVDPASGCCYAPVDLNDPRLIATDGLGPSETNPQFHQQMAYAVSMKTIQHFEKALGRVALWSASFHCSGDGQTQEERLEERFVQRLRIYPHALRASNAFYSPERKALLLGYFAAGSGGDGGQGELIFSALSHDIVAHETSHALLDGLHRRFREPTNPDVLAFHEAFADIVALFQHFSMPDSLREEIGRSGGNLAAENLLAKLAVQFGQGTGHYGALRDSIGSMERDPATDEYEWKPTKPSRDQYTRSTEPHERGSVLVAAVFDAFLKIYERRAREPILLATGGSGVLPTGALPAGLADALTGVASSVAAHVLTMCIRGLDYCPPVDLTFADYLRAVVTADRELVPKDPYSYRVALVSAFAARGIYPHDVRSLSVESMLWEPPPVPFASLRTVLAKLDLGWDLRSQRRNAWATARDNARRFREWLLDPALVADAELEVLGLKRAAVSGVTLTNASGEQIACDLHGIEVHSIRPSRRVGPDGQLLSQLVVEITQSYYTIGERSDVYRGGVTLVIDLTKQEVVYLLRKRAEQPARISEQQAFRRARMEQAANRYPGPAVEQAEPFKFLHWTRPRREYGSLHS
jgi:hypothetical protein